LQSSFKIEDIEGSKFYNQINHDKIIIPKIKSLQSEEIVISENQNKQNKEKMDNIQLILKDNIFVENKLDYAPCKFLGRWY
jgi:hypothetical protein